MTERTLTDLATAVQEYDGDQAALLAQQALDEGTEPVVILDALTACIREVGEAFGAGDLFLPELVGAADAMESAMPIVVAALKAQGGSRTSAGKVVAGTVAGDIHNIGKSIFCTLLTADGFEVIDLGIDVKVDKFVDTIKEEKPDVVAMSALLTITAQEQQNVITALESAGLREGLKIIVGGGAISQRFADTIGADGYSPTAPGGVTLVRELLV
jgi:corrinoid protein of di/trimethylamine methyltransferase